MSEPISVNSVSDTAAEDQSTVPPLIYPVGCRRGRELQAFLLANDPNQSRGTFVYRQDSGKQEKFEERKKLLSVAEMELYDSTIEVAIATMKKFMRHLIEKLDVLKPAGVPPLEVGDRGVVALNEEGVEKFSEIPTLYEGFIMISEKLSWCGRKGMQEINWIQGFLHEVYREHLSIIYDPCEVTFIDKAKKRMARYFVTFKGYEHLLLTLVSEDLRGQSDPPENPIVVYASRLIEVANFLSEKIQRVEIANQIQSVSQARIDDYPRDGYPFPLSRTKEVSQNIIRANAKDWGLHGVLPRAT